MNPLPNPWLGRHQGRPAASLRLICLPFAGGSSSAFAGWAKALPEWIEVLPIELPGRQARFQEARFDRIDTLVPALASAIEGLLDRPYALYGHSMGALVAFELAHRFRDAGIVEPEILFAAAHRAPRCPHESIVSELPDEQLIAHVRRLSGSDYLVDNAALLKLILPTLRADLAICDHYVRKSRDPLACPIFAINGEEDNMQVDEINAWQDETTGSFETALLPGGHFFITSHEQDLLAVLARQLSRAMVRS